MDTLRELFDLTGLGTAVVVALLMAIVGAWIWELYIKPPLLRHRTARSEKAQRELFEAEEIRNERIEWMVVFPYEYQFRIAQLNRYWAMCTRQLIIASTCLVSFFGIQILEKGNNVLIYCSYAFYVLIYFSIYLGWRSRSTASEIHSEICEARRLMLEKDLKSKKARSTN